MTDDQFKTLGDAAIAMLEQSLNGKRKGDPAAAIRFLVGLLARDERDRMLSVKERESLLKFVAEAMVRGATEPGKET